MYSFLAARGWATDRSLFEWYSAERAAKSNNAHIITFGARVIGPELAKTIVNAWLASEFDPQGASAGNVAAVSELDRKYRK